MPAMHSASRLVLPFGFLATCAEGSGVWALSVPTCLVSEAIFQVSDNGLLDQGGGRELHIRTNLMVEPAGFTEGSNTGWKREDSRTTLRPEPLGGWSSIH